MDVPSSLRALYESGCCLPTSSRVCVPLCTSFWEYVTANEIGEANTASELADVYAQCLLVKKDTPKCVGFDALLKQAREGVRGEGEFPGPMCSPLRRLDLSRLSQTEYTFTEKSDGIRTIVVIRECSHFPQWNLATDRSFTQHLSVVAELEAARRHLKDAGGAETTTIGCGRTAFKMAWLRIHDVVEGDHEAYSFTPVDDTGAALGDAFTVTRSLGAVPVAFALDRAMDNFYVLCDSPGNLTCTVAVLDGELMATCPTSSDSGEVPPFVLGLFDVFSYRAVGGDASSMYVAVNAMQDRYATLQSLLTERPAEAPCAGEGQSAGDMPAPQPVIRWFVKTMWPIEQFGACLSRLHYDTDGRFYYYDDPRGWRTKNDGFILTPNHFPVVSGASATQFKWKWKNSLSVDWRVRAVRPGGSLHDMYLFFRKKRHGFQPDTVGHWKLQHPWELENPHGFVISTKPSEAAIVECVYNFSTGKWSMERLRQDKTQANAITTAISVMESLAEDLSLVTLLRQLCVADVTALAQAATLDSYAAGTPGSTTAGTRADQKNAKKAPPFTAQFSVRAVSALGNERNFYLYWCTNTTGNPDVPRPTPAPLCRVRDCTGLGTDEPATSGAEDANTRLEALLFIELANAGGSYGWSDFIVDACFNGETGRWDIVRMHPHSKSKVASFEHALVHLNWLITQGGGAAARRALPKSAVQSRPALLRQMTGASRCPETALTNAHYGDKARELSGQAKDRSVLRQFHNWIKSMMLWNVVERAKKQCGDRLFILDVCCGRGGDLHKWKEARPAFVFMTDASVDCVAEAAGRYCVSEGMSLMATKDRRPGFKAHFAVHDAFDPVSTLRADLLQVRREHGHGFAVASCQFSMHYACHSLERITCFVETVAASLSPGGLFTGTTVCDKAIVRLFAERGAVYQCETYGVRFPDTTAAQLNTFTSALASGENDGPMPFGLAYYITIENTVSDLPEFIVPWEPFVDLCATFSLKLIEDTAFESLYEAEKDSEQGRLLRGAILKKKDRDGAPLQFELSTTEKEAAGLYRAFVFEKQAPESL